MSELKSCPKCQSTDVGASQGKAYCYNCGIQSKEHINNDHATNNWNTRTESAEREQLHSLFERVSGCEVSEFDKSQLPYLADMIEGQMDANEGCIEQLRKERDELKEVLINVLHASEMNTGNEPSLSAFHRSVDEDLNLLESLKED